MGYGYVILGSLIIFGMTIASVIRINILQKDKNWKGTSDFAIGFVSGIIVMIGFIFSLYGACIHNGWLK